MSSSGFAGSNLIWEAKVWTQAHCVPRRKGLASIPSSTRVLLLASPETTVPVEDCLGWYEVAKEKNRTVKGACIGGG
jgi:hypothetical protein